MPCHVLLVEDSTLVTDALTILLESAGHVVRVAASAADAIALGTGTRAQLMLLDLSLPDGDGLSVLATLRDAGAEPAITVALTGHDDPSVRERCLAAGCRDVLVKPVPARELLARVAEWAEEIGRASEVGGGKSKV
ncbi:MAG TPA: response regulator [Gemmatimonadales bacterium]